ncbi:MAG: threonine synthase, partial [Erysipelotrichaceae bacterium]|nr:threonine synthase [Erysipelotrichaceae bacterium]
MKTYHSTRNLHIQASFHEAVLQGIASDGGLFVKDDIQKDKIDLDTLLHASYQEMAIAVLSKFLDDFSNEQI